MEEAHYFPINEKIKNRRLELRLNDVEAAYQIRQSIYEYGDIESYADEIFVVVPLYHIKKLCSTLKMDFFTLFEIPFVFCEEGETYLNDYLLSRDLLVRKKREALGLSRG